MLAQQPYVDLSCSALRDTVRLHGKSRFPRLNSHRSLRRLVAGAAKAALGPVARATSGRRGRILMYHRFGSAGTTRSLQPAALEQQLRHLLRHYSVMPLRDIVECIREQKSLPRLPVALTVDDGYSDFVELAYPVFQRLRVPVTLYVTSQFVSGRLWLWWDSIRHLVERAPARSVDFGFGGSSIRLQLLGERDRGIAWSALADVGVRLSPDLRDQMIVELQRRLGIMLPPEPTPEFAAASWPQLRQLDPSIVEIGAHTRTHPILSRCDAPRILDEVAGSRADIEAQLDRQVVSFCYPNGQPDDVDERCLSAARDAGYQSAVMACGGFCSSQSDPFALERMPARHDVTDFYSVVAGVPDLLRRSS